MEANIIAEHKGIKIALTSDCKFVGDDGKKYNSLSAIKKAIDARSTGDKLKAFVRHIADMNLIGHLRLTDHDGEDAITTLDYIMREIVGGHD
jgi:hypothetical protein